MRTLLMVGVLAGVGLVGGGTLYAASAQHRWREESRAAFGSIDRAACGALPVTTIPSDLPAPVARYFRFALSVDPSPVVRALITWDGEMRMKPGADWVPFSATQAFSTEPPAFVWDANIRVMRLVPVRVRDGYRAQQGSMEARVLGIAPVVERRGTPELAQGALARWLGEAVWFPSALVPAGDGRIRWEALDDSTARAIVTDGEVTAMADFSFAPSGEILSMRALRYRDMGGSGVLTPFEGQYATWVRRGGYMVPGSAEVAWLLPEGRYAYWRARPERIDYACE
jgi:hypothetical protein